MKKKVEVEKLYNPTYVIAIVKELLEKCEIEYGSVTAYSKDGLASVTYKKKDKLKHIRKLEPWKPIKMWYVDIDNYDDMSDELYEKFYIRLGYLVLDNDLVNKGYDITATLLN